MQINIDGVTKFQTGKYPKPLLNGATHWATFIWKGHQCSIVGDEKLIVDLTMNTVLTLKPRPSND